MRNVIFVFRIAVTKRKICKMADKCNVFVSGNISNRIKMYRQTALIAILLKTTH